MKSFQIIHESGKDTNQIYPQRVRVGRAFPLFLTFCIISSVMIFSSCAVGVRTPQRHSSGVIIESHTRVVRPVRVRHIRVENHDRRDRREHDRDDD